MKNSEFKKAARKHQIEYKLKKTGSDYSTYETWLTKSDSDKGKNFYNGFSIFSEVQKRYPKHSINLYSDILRSQHIPFNFFIPFRNDLNFCKNVFNELLGNCIHSIDIESIIDNKGNVKIEFAPSPKKKYLDDNTSFDTYIEFTHIDGGKGIIGIEVKYTEKEYPLKKGSSEERKINDPKSNYQTTTNKIEIYEPDSIKDLKKDLFRQIWRNQLLGEKMLLVDKDKFKHFSSLVFFPEKNEHFIHASNEYIEMLIENKNKFLPITYESFLKACNRHCPNNEFKKWVNYLIERYIF